MKRSIKTIIALALVGCMTIGSSVIVGATMYTEDTEVVGSDDCVIAEGPETDVTVKGDIDTNDNEGALASGGAKITVSGSVSNEGTFGAKADDAGSKVTVEGDVEAGFEAVQTMNGGKVVVNGSVTGGTYAANADTFQTEDGGSITIGQNANGDVAAHNGNIEIKGNVNGADVDKSETGAAISESGKSTIIIGENVNAPGTGIKTDGDSVIMIGDTLTSSGSDPIILYEATKVDDAGVYSKDTSKGASTIVVYEVKGNLNNLVKAGYQSGRSDYMADPQVVPEFVEDATMKEEQIKNIFYIIKTSEGSEKGIDSFAGTTEFKNGNNETINAAPENTVVTVKVKEGYGLKAGTIKLTDNRDGSYTLTVPRGGGVMLTTEQLQKAVDEIEKKEEEKKEEKKDDKKDDKDDDKKDESKTIATIASNNVSPFVAYAPVLTIGGGQAVLSGGTFGADTGIKMEEPGPLAEAAFAQAMPEGFTKGFSFSVTNGGQTTYSIKNGKISFKIPAQYLLAGRQFKLIGVDKDGNTKVFDNVATEDGSFEADVDIEGYQFELVYKD